MFITNLDFTIFQKSHHIIISKLILTISLTVFEMIKPGMNMNDEINYSQENNVKTQLAGMQIPGVLNLENKNSLLPESSMMQKMDVSAILEKLKENQARQSQPANSDN